RRRFRAWRSCWTTTPSGSPATTRPSCRRQRRRPCEWGARRQDMARLSYHAATAREVYGTASPKRSTSAAEVRALERRLGRKLPASVREWVAYFGDLGLCAGSQDRALRLAEWGSGRGGVDHLPAGYLGVMIENQGCCQWAVQLDGSDD